MNISFEGKTVIVTGATSGIGKEIAGQFAQNGASVVVNGIDRAAGGQVVEQIQNDGGTAVYVEADVSCAQAVREMADTVIETFGKIDFLVNNAGINVEMKDRGPIHEFPDHMWEKILRVDLDGVYYCSKAVLPNMIENHFGRIVNISSVTGLVPLRNQCAFTAAKAGVIHLTKAMAIELAEFGVNVNVVCPGSIQIPIMIEGGMYTDGRYEAIMSHIPMHRPGTPREIASMVQFLCSDQANYITGGVHAVDGGWMCGFARDW